MRFLIPNLYSYGLDEICSVLCQKGYSVVLYSNNPRNFYYDPVFQRGFIQMLAEQEIDAVFSLQFFPIISNICEKQKIPYISWCYNDQINSLLLTESIYNACNYIFHTDSKWVLKLSRLGAGQVYYLPWAARTFQKDAISSKSAVDIAFFDMTDIEALRLYRKILAQLDQRTKGFLDGLMQAQAGVYGFNFVENVLNDTVLSALQATGTFLPPRGNIADIEELYAFQVLYPVITKKDSDAVLKKLKQEGQLNACFYTSCPLEQSEHIRQSDMPSDAWGLVEIYKNSRINLLAAPREIESGIPVQAMDIMGCGGFLLTNFQNDYLQYFEPEADYVYYESVDDMMDKIHYYLQHDKERIAVSQNAFQKIVKNHTFELRLDEMLNLLNLN